MTKHTPAPWTCKAAPYEDGTPYFTITAGAPFGPGGKDGKSGKDGFKFNAIMKQEDADLICRAPVMADIIEELTASLEQAVQLLQVTPHPDVPFNIKKAREAIAKAKL